MTYKFSPSSLNLLKECPRCFWLHFNKNIRRPSTIFPSLPGGMDKILKIHFDNFMEKNKLPPELSKCKDLRLFNDKKLLEEWRNNFRGIQWKDKEGNLFRGAVDNILVKKDKLIVLDYKTRGYPLKEDTHEHYQDQMDIYNLLLRKNNYKTENYSYLLFYHPDKVNKDGNIIFNTDLIKMKVNIENAESIFEKAIKTLKSKIPEGNCEFCKWSKKVNSL